MDVLQFLKLSHDQIREDLGRFLKADGIKSRRTVFEPLVSEISIRLLLERDYLYPELTGLFPEADVVVTTGLANGSALSKRLKILEKLLSKTIKEQNGIEKKIEEFACLLEGHFNQQEQHLMHKLRQTMRTDDREELGQVFEDVSKELKSGTLDLESKAVSLSRKRA